MTNIKNEIAAHLIKEEKWNTFYFSVFFIRFLLIYNTIGHKRKSFSNPKILILIFSISALSKSGY